MKEADFTVRKTGRNQPLSLLIRATFVVLLTGLFLSASRADDTAQAVPAMPTMSLSANTIDGAPVDISMVPGWRVIYFWSTVCPCVRACEKYSFIPLAEKYRGQVSFYAIASDGWDLKLPRAEFASDVKQHDLPFPVLIDSSHTIAQELGARVTPETFVLDPSGNVVFEGMPDDSRRFLFQQLKRTGGKLPPVPQTYLATALAEALDGKPITPSPIKESGCIIAW